MSNQLIYCRSRLNGWNGNKCVYNSDYKTAIQYYNNAIELYPLEYRYFVNRSYCYDQLCQFEWALADADRALGLNPEWGKCHFRKARALKGLNRLQEAELCFLKVMELEGQHCSEALNELTSLRQLALIECGLESAIAEEVANRSIDINEAMNSMKREVNESKKYNEKTIELHRNRAKKSNKSSSIKVKNVLNGKQMSYGLENTSIENTLDEIKKIETNISFESKRLQIQWSCADCSAETNVLKKLSDFLLNTNTWVLNKSKDDSQSIDRISSEECLEKCVEKSDQKCRSDDNKSMKSLSNESKVKPESKSRPVLNRKNGRKNYLINEMVDIWDDSKSRWPSLRSHIGFANDSNRKSEPTNPWRFKGLWVSNIIPTEQTRKLLRDILSQFGRITLIDVIPETGTALINYDNPESPRVAMARLQGVHMPNICINNEKLRIKFRPLIDNKNYPSINSATDRQLNNECYFWRTTGCKFSYFKYCANKHIPANQGVDLQPWMQCLKNKYRRQHRQ